MRFSAWALRLLIILWMALVVPASYALVLSTDTPRTVATPTPTPSPANGTSPADASLQAKKASDAATKVEQAVSTAASLIDQAEKYRKSIGDITGATTGLSQSTLDSLQTLQTTVLVVQQNNLISALRDTKALESAKSAEGRAIRGFTTRALGQTCRSHAQEIIGFLGGLTESVVVW